MGWSDIPKKVVLSEETKNRITNELLKFQGRNRFPANELAFNAFVEAVGDIVHDKPEGSLWNKPAEQPHFVIKQMIGNDLEWLIKKALARFRHCPSPRDLRAMYCEYFTPADGVCINEAIDD